MYMLTESQLHRIFMDSMNRILNEDKGRYICETVDYNDHPIDIGDQVIFVPFTPSRPSKMDIEDIYTIEDIRGEKVYLIDADGNRLTADPFELMWYDKDLYDNYEEESDFSIINF